LQKKHKILVYSGGELIGDALYKLNFFQYLRYCYPNSSITFLSGQGTSEYFSSLKIVSEKLFDLMIDNISIGNKKNFLRDLFRKSLIKENYDVVIDTQSDYRCTLILKKIKTKIFISYSLKWFLSDLKPKNKTIESLNERLIQMVNLINDFYDVKKPHSDYFPINIPPNYDEIAKKILPSKKTYIGIAIGAGDKRKIWPLKNFLKIADFYKSTYAPVFFLGPKEVHLKKKIKDKISNAIFPNTTSFDNSDISGPLLVISLAKRLKFCISNDSGIGHMFAASRRPQITLFSLSNYKKYSPLNPNIIILDSKKWGTNNPNGISVKEVLDATEQLSTMS
jgi:ADP-heptose:LPS heptosyltransferase